MATGEPPVFSGLHPLTGLRVYTCSETCSHDLRCTGLPGLSPERTEHTRDVAGLSGDQWLRITQVHALVKQEGDARCEAALDDLIAAHNRLAEALDRVDEFHVVYVRPLELEELLPARSQASRSPAAGETR